jgi:hypothetical protein
MAMGLSESQLPTLAGQQDAV